MTKSASLNLDALDSRTFDIWFASLNPAPVLRFNRSALIEMANPAAEKLFGTPTFLGTSILELVPELLSLNFEDWFDSSEDHSFNAMVSGRYLSFTLRSVPDMDLGYMYGADVTDLKITEEKLLSSQGFLRKVIDTNPNLIFVKDRQGRFMLANEAVAKVYGTTVERLIGKTDADFNGSDQEVQNFCKDDQFVIDTCSDLFIPEEYVTTASQETIWLETVKKPIHLFDGRVMVLGVATDITTRKTLQSQLLHAQKLEAVGQLAGGIAHDFNNLLTGMLGYSNMLMTSHNLDPESRRAVSMIRNAAEQATELTQKLLGFARKGKHQNVAVDIHKVVDDTLALLNRTLEKNIIIQRSLHAENSYVCGDPVQLQQIMLNLALNARDSMTAENRSLTNKLTISTSIVPRDEVNSTAVCALPSQSFLKISVSDTGCGISSENLARVFDPFFTTKDEKHGTGLGLSMVYGIVKNHNGCVTVQSEVGRGSTFDVFLPCYGEETTRPPRTELEISSVKGKGRIMLVDDHQVIRSVTSDMLKSLGYEVIAARDGLEAVEYFKRHDRDIDLIILDMIMPGIGAKECFDRLKAINQSVKVVLSTGYVANNSIQEILDQGMVGFVQKPYMLGQLSKIVAEAMSGQHKAPVTIH